MSSPRRRTATARERFSVVCGTICILSVLACFIAKLFFCGGIAFVSGILGAISAKSDVTKVMFVLGALAVPVAVIVIFALAGSR